MPQPRLSGELGSEDLAHPCPGGHRDKDDKAALETSACDLGGHLPGPTSSSWVMAPPFARDTGTDPPMSCKRPVASGARRPLCSTRAPASQQDRSNSTGICAVTPAHGDPSVSSVPEPLSEIAITLLSPDREVPDGDG